MSKQITIRNVLDALAVLVAGLSVLPLDAVAGEVGDDGQVVDLDNDNGIVEGSLRDDGSVELEGWNRAVAESRASKDKWDRLWAAQTNRIDRWMIKDTLSLPNLTERQKLNVAKNLEHAGARAFMWGGYDVNATAVERRGTSEFAFEMTPNESGLGQASSYPIPGVGSFGTQATADEAYEYALIARRKWIEGQPAWVSETTGVVYGKPPEDSK